MSGLTPLGFDRKTQEQILAETNAQQLEEIDAALDLDPDQPLGQINGISSNSTAEVWELAEDIWTSFDADAAEGVSLDHWCALTGTEREPAKKTRVAASVNLNGSFTLPAGSIASVAGQSDRKFATVAPVPSTTAGNYPAVFEALEYGPIPCNAGTLTVIPAPIAGWNSVTNAADGDVGRFVETDTALGLRRKSELSASGACGVDSIRADILRAFKGRILECRVFENTSNLTDGDGLPPHSIEAVIYDDDNAVPNNEIAQVVWDGKPSGGGTYGSITATAVDSLGVSQETKFSRATVVEPYFVFEVQVDESYPLTGDDLIKQEVVKLGEAALKLGVDVNATKFKACALNVPGVVDFLDFRLGTSPGPTDTVTIPISARAIAKIDTTKISVTSVPA